MRQLYVDNYRGFFDTYIPLMDVNFLVGENSTGKTSILALLERLSKPDFWFSQDFNSPEFQLGTFKDIASGRTTSAREFKIGFMEVGEADKEPWAYLIVYGESDGQPIVKRYHLFQEGSVLSIVFQRGGFYYTYSPMPNIKEHQLLLLFKQWISQVGLPRGEKGGFIADISYPPNRRLVIPRFLIERKIHGEPGAKSDEKPVSLGYASFAESFVWIAPVRSKPKRTYDALRLDFSSEGEHIPYMIRRLLREEKSKNDFKKYMVRIGKEAGLFSSISIEEFGKSPASPFALNILFGQKSFNIRNVGYGVSQCLPVIVELFHRRAKTWFAIQQPEVHLHPRAQAAFGDLVFRLAGREHKCFLIETHSDYLIDRFRLRSSKERKHISAQVIFFQRMKSGNCAFSIPILPNGDYAKEQPTEFRKFFITEELDLLRIR